MAEKTTKKAPAAAAAAASTTAPAPGVAAPAAPAAPKTIDTFAFVKPVAEGEKLAPQARVIVNVLADLKTATREDLAKALEGKLQTRQPIGRIVTYYQKSLVERGYITISAVPVA